jgi:chromosome segregation ATPase
MILTTEEAMGTRDAFVQKLKAQLDEGNAEIDKLEAKAGRAEADVKIRYQEEIEKLRQQQQSAQAKLEELQQANEDAWEDLKDGVVGAWDSLKGAFEKAKSRF